MAALDQSIRSTHAKMWTEDPPRGVPYPKAPRL